jgi:hypothetical protein
MKLYLYIALGVAIIGGLWYFIKEQREIGGTAERLKQVEENERFKDRATKGISGYDACDDAGGVYDFRKGSCKLP